MSGLVNRLIDFNEQYQAAIVKNLAAERNKWTRLQDTEIPDLYKKAARLTYVMLPLIGLGLGVSTGCSYGVTALGDKTPHKTLKGILTFGVNSLPLFKEGGSSVIEGMKHPITGQEDLRKTDRDTLSQKRNQELEAMREVQGTLDKALQTEEREATA